MRRFGTEQVEFDVGKFGKLRFAQWLHPLARPAAVSEAAIEKLRTYLNEGDVVIDIGAHVGDTTIPYAAAVGATGRVLAFEPNPAVYEVVSKSAELNPEYNITCVNYAVTAETGIYTFHYTDPDLYNGGFAESIDAGIGASSHSYPVYVVGVNLEDWLQENYSELVSAVRFVKVDAEGYDKELLKTFPRLLQTARPLLQVELFPSLSREERIDFYRTIVALGYRPYNFTEAGWDFDKIGRPLSEHDFLALDFSRVFDIFCVPE